MTLAQYEAGMAQSQVPTSAEVFSSLSAVEQQLCTVMYRIEIVGKCDRKVPVLFYAELKDTIDYLVCALPANSIPLVWVNAF